MDFIDLKTQYQRYKQEIDQAVHQVLEAGQFILGPEVKELEELLADYVGVKHAIGCASGTDTLFMALLALGIGPGDEVITTPWTWVSTVEVISLVGATPVLVDIDPKTYNIDPILIEAAITSRTKAIMPVGIFGQMADMSAINAIAEKYGIAVIEDGAQSFGAMHRGKRSCSMSLVGSTSFFPSKPLGCYGDGGMLFTNDDVLNEKLRLIRVHGGNAQKEFKCIGITGRLDTIQAAILLAKMPHFEEELLARKRIAERYNDLLKDVCITPQTATENTHVYAIYTIRHPQRDLIAQHLKEKGIPTALYYPKAVHLHPAYAYLGYGVGSFPILESLGKEVISLPMHPWLDEKTQDFIVEAVQEALCVAGRK